jgi:hypothetical protein
MAITPGQPIPSQAGQSGKFLTTNGTALGWGTASASPGGSSGELQWNNAGSFAGAAALTYAATGTHLLATAQAATYIPFAVKLASSQSGNAVEVRDSADVVKMSVGPLGGVSVRGVSADTTVGYRLLRSTDAVPILKIYEVSGQPYIDNTGLNLTFTGSGTFAFGSDCQFTGSLSRAGGNGRLFFASGGSGVAGPIFETLSTSQPTLWCRAIASQTANLQEWVSSSNAVLSTVSENGYFTTRKTAAPADGELAAGELAWWFDSTNGAGKLKIKAKTADGTVVTGEVALA